LCHLILKMTKRQSRDRIGSIELRGTRGTMTEVVSESFNLFLAASGRDS
jgi:hypothetical protein